ncbi:MAG: hypothetical protein WA733_24185 [Methylocystis sp.]
MAQPPPDLDIGAVRAALDLFVAPSRGRRFQSAALPEGMTLLLRIVADDQGAIEASAQRTRNSPRKLREAAAFYVEQILLAANSDSYRVLGARRNATAGELRRHLALLCKWLHSERCPELARSMFFLRITHAWNNLKTPERRADYDATLDARLAAPATGKARVDDFANTHGGNGKAQPPRGEALAARQGQARIDGARKRKPHSLWRRLIVFAFGARAR